MEFLYKNKNSFLSFVSNINILSGLDTTIIEKDYYVTMLLRLLSNKLDYIVFKGGTSLSKTQKVINRFSEDIDISTSRKITQGEKRKVKASIIEAVDELGMTIDNINDIRSRRDYNLYRIKYDSILNNNDKVIQNVILLEVVYMSVAYPTSELFINNYFDDYVDNKDMIIKFGLEPFKMNVQSLERTFIDKVFAICDYFLLSKKYRNSRHIYDLYKIYPLVKFDKKFKSLVKDIRRQREGSDLRPSANKEININEILKNIINSKFYKEDFDTITKTFLNEEISYEVVIKVLNSIINDQYFI